MEKRRKVDLFVLLYHEGCAALSGVQGLVSFVWAKNVEVHIPGEEGSKCSPISINMYTVFPCIQPVVH